MVEQQSTWTGRTAAKQRERTRAVPRLPSIRSRIHPLEWISGAPAATAIILLGISGLAYLLQVNQASWLEFRLTRQAALQTQLNARRAVLLVRRDALLAEHHIDLVATTKLHMERPSLDTALWLRVSVPRTTPHAIRAPAVSTGPLTWMSTAVHDIGASL